MHMEKSTALFVVFVRCFCPVVSCGDFVRWFRAVVSCKGSFESDMEETMTKYFMKLELQDFQEAVRAVLSGKFPVLPMTMHVEGNRNTFVPRGDWVFRESLIAPQSESIFACLLVLSHSRPVDFANRILPGQTILSVCLPKSLWLPTLDHDVTFI